jgi:hypothetical protein
MDEDSSLLEITIDKKNYLRLYAYTYHDELRFTVSLETDDSVISSEHLKPAYCPFTGKKVSSDSEDMHRLTKGISLKQSNGKILEHCCFIEGETIHLHTPQRHLHYHLAFDPLTGIGARRPKS